MPMTLTSILGKYTIMYEGYSFYWDKNSTVA